MELTKAQKRDLLLVAKGDVCSKSQPTFPARNTNYFYSRINSYEIITTKMIEKLINMELVEYGEYYTKKHNVGAMTPWGRYIKLTKRGEKIIKEST